MTTKTILLLALLALSGCSSTPAMKDRPEELAKLPQWTQVSYVLETPLTLIAWGAVIWALNGGSLVKSVTVRNKDKSP